MNVLEASGISVGENLPVTLTTELFLDSEPEAKPATAVRRLAIDRLRKKCYYCKTNWHFKLEDKF